MSMPRGGKLRTPLSNVPAPLHGPWLAYCRVKREPVAPYNAAVREWRQAKRAAGYCAGPITCWMTSGHCFCPLHEKQQSIRYKRYFATRRISTRKSPRWSRMLVVLAMPGLKAEVRDIPAGDAALEALKKMVGGWIDKTYWPFDDASMFPEGRKAVLWVNDEGLRQRLAPNLPHPSGIVAFEGQRTGHLLGPVVVSAYDEADGDELGLPDSATALTICHMLDEARGL